MRCLLLGIVSIAVHLAFFLPSAAALQAGVNKTELPTPEAVPLAGHLYRHGQSATAQHTPLWVRSLYLEQEGTSIAWVSLDLHTISPDLRERVLELAPAGLPPDNIILTATHTHNGPGGYDTSWLMRQFSGRYMPEWVEMIAQTVAQSIESAMTAQTRATIGFAESNTNPLVLPQYESNQSVDATIGVIRVDDSDGTPMAIITSMGGRPDTLGKQHALALSPDYPGYYATALEEITPEGCVAFFANGASGDQVCANPDELQGTAWAETMGQQLAQRTKALSNSITGREVSLSFFTRSLSVPPALSEAFIPNEFIIQAIVIDKTLISFWPGTLFSGFSQALKGESRSWGYTRHFPIGTSNGNFMALVPPEQYAQSLEPGLNLFGPEMLAWCKSQLEAMVNNQDPSTPPTLSSQPPNIEPFNGGVHITLNGTPEEMGFQIGMAQDETLKHILTERIYPAVPNNTAPGYWKSTSRIQSYPLFLPFYANKKVALLNGWRTEDQAWLQGMSKAMQLPFAKAALLESYEKNSIDGTPLSTTQGILFAVTDNKAGTDGLLVGRTLEYPDPIDIQIVEVHPKTGRSYVYAGVPWQSGVLSGMNDAGVVVCAQWLNPASPPPHRFAASYVLKSLLNKQNSLEKALAYMEEFDVWEGFRILLADRPKTDAVILEFGPEPIQINATDGVLKSLSMNGTSTKHLSLIEETGNTPMEVRDIQNIISHRPPWSDEEDRVFNDDTIAAIVFEPAKTIMYVATQRSDGTPSNFHVITLSRETP